MKLRSGTFRSRGVRRSKRVYEHQQNLRSQEYEHQQSLCSHGMKRPRDCEDISSPNKRFKGNIPYLPLYLHTRAKVEQPPRVKTQFPPVYFDNEDRDMPVVIGGRRFIAASDSGTTNVVMKFRPARRLARLPNKRTTRYKEFYTWDGVKGNLTTVVHDVEMTLRNNMTVRLDITILSKEESDMLDDQGIEQDMLMGMEFLIRYNVVEKCSEDLNRRCLMFRSDPVPEIPQGDETFLGYALDVHLVKNKKDPIKSMHLDTGSCDIYTDILNHYTEKVGIHLRKGVKIMGTLSNEPTPLCAFNLGLDILNDYNAVIDYVNAKLYVLVGGVYYRINLTNLMDVLSSESQ